MTQPTYEHRITHPAPQREAFHDVRAAARLAHARPAIAAGVRAGFATIAPLLADTLFHVGGGAWMSLAGLNGALLDRGGPYRLRAANMSALAVASAIAVFLGTLAAGHLAISVVLTFILGLLCGAARAWPEVGASFGVTVLVTYAIALAVPEASLAGTVMRAVYILIGGLWAMLIAIVVWPLRPYRPVRLRVSTCYRELADYLDAVVGESGAARHEPWEFKDHRVNVRDALEAARVAIASSRRGRSGDTRRGERLVILRELADEVYAHLLALLDVVDALRSSDPATPAHRALSECLGEIAAALRQIGDNVEVEHDRPRVPVRCSGDRVRARLSGLAGSAALNYEQAANLLDRITEYADMAAAATSTLTSGDPIPEIDAQVGPVDIESARTRLSSLPSLVRADSVILQHALRIACVTSSAVLLAGLLHLNHGYWITLTAVVILQPYASMTRQKAWQRVIGTIVGASAAAGLSALFAGSWAVMALVFIFTALCVMLLPVNYGAYAILGTPAFVLLAEATTGEWHLAGLRVVNTLIGGTLALVGARLLWPGDEWNRLPEHVAETLRGMAAYLRRAAAVAATGEVPMGALRVVRRELAFAATRAEDSFQRIVGEGRAGPQTLESVMTVLVYSRRASSSIASFGLVAAGNEASAGHSDAATQIGERAARVLDDLADAIAAGRMPAPFPARAELVPDGAGTPILRARAARLARQLQVLHDATGRWMSVSDRPSMVDSRAPTGEREATTER
ncbi:MAG TPA: FUSC family protein [Gemmatimonadaceae bacterium]|nr:FUSC family protein [Gemmatimonadaceae bacterium]